MLLRKPNGAGLAMFDTGNLLARVPGEIIAGGSKPLPAPESMPVGTEMHAEVDVRDIGRVCLTYIHTTHRHGRGTYHSWRAVRADYVAATANADRHGGGRMSGHDDETTIST